MGVAGGKVRSEICWATACGLALGRDPGAKPQAARQEVGSLHLQTLAELAQRLALDLADALAGQAEALADLLERLGLLVVQAEAHAQHRRLALVHLVEE